MNTQTQINAVVGYPLTHTLSPLLHHAVYQKMGLHAVLLPLPQKKLVTIIRLIHDFPLHLTAVTMPHKQAIIKYLDHLDPVAKKIGAVNTVINRQGKLHGFNTDVVGVQQALKNTALKHKNILLLGAGGAARPVAYVINQAKGKLFCFNRTRSHAVQLVKTFGGQVINQRQLENMTFDVIINTTPLGMFPDLNVSPLPANFLKPSHTVFDLIYNPRQTKLLRDASRVGAITISGLTMFIAQGLEQIRLWSGKEISITFTDMLRKKLSTSLATSRHPKTKKLPKARILHP